MTHCLRAIRPGKGILPLGRMLAGLGVVLACLATGAGTPMAGPGQDLKAVEGGAALRARPQPDADILLALTPEHRLVEFERRSGWVKVGVYGEIGAFGWVPVGDVAPVARTAELPATPDEPQEDEPALPEAPVYRFRLDIKGTPAILYRGNCGLLGAAGQAKSVKLAGSIPNSYVFEGIALSCLVRKWDAQGRLRVRLYDGDRLVARGTTAAPFNHIEIRTASPWGQASAIRGDFPRIRRKVPKPSDEH